MDLGRPVARHVVTRPHEERGTDVEPDVPTEHADVEASDARPVPG